VFVVVLSNVETYVGVFNMHYICIVSSAFVGCYEDCDKIHGVYIVQSVESCAGPLFSLWREGCVCVTVYLAVIILFFWCGFTFFFGSSKQKMRHPHVQWICLQASGIFT
jgi:hypothetical protein